MITAVDTNILLDILRQDPLFCESSKNLLQRHINMGPIIISPIVYSELLGFFLKYDNDSSVNKLEEFLKELSINVSIFGKEDLVSAAKAWQNFSQASGVTCPKCRGINIFNCAKCDAKVLWRNHILTDFLIGAHAQNHAEVLLTRDRGYYKKYFKVKIMP